MSLSKTGIVKINLKRRHFLKTLTLVGGGLWLGWIPETSASMASNPSTPFTPSVTDPANPFQIWVHIGKDEKVTVRVHHSEMGQGVSTSIPMLVAEELEVPFEWVNFEFAPVASYYRNPVLSSQFTGGSTSLRTSFAQLRKVGATAREMLREAGAKELGVPVLECDCLKGEVIHRSSQKKIGYGALAESASKMAIPTLAPLKKPSDFKLIGTSPLRLDGHQKVHGKAQYGIDVRLPNLAVGAIKQSPVFGGKVKKIDESPLNNHPDLKLKGIFNLGDCVGILSDNFYTSQKALDLIKIERDLPLNLPSTSDLVQKFQELSKTPGVRVQTKGDLKKVKAEAKKLVQQDYSVPFLNHATMEPMNCTAFVESDKCTLYAPTQAQERLQMAAAGITGLSPSLIKVHTTFLGGGFGRRFESDFGEQAVKLSKLSGLPVKLIWSREEDMQHGFYRPMAFSRLEGVLDESGKLIGWSNKLVSPSILSRLNPAVALTKTDNSSTEGAAEIPYAIPHIEVDYVLAETPVPIGFWRSVGSSFNAFFVESFIDRCAKEGGKDPIEYRLDLLSGAPREKALLEFLTEKTGRKTCKGDENTAFGVAIHKSFGSLCAQMAQVEKDGNSPGGFKVKKITCVFDCGRVIHPNGLTAQIEGAIIFGLSAALFGENTLEKGAIVQSNFHDYPVCRIDQVPEIEVHFLENDSEMGGGGEPGVPPVAPAVANALLALFGKPIDSLPIIRPKV